MNMILLFKDDLIGPSGIARVSGRRYGHITGIHKAAAGDELCVGLAGGMMGRGRILSISKASLEMEVSLTNQPPAPLPVKLILALPRPIMLGRILTTAASMGVKSVYLIGSERVEKSYWQSPALGEEKIGERLILGLEQAKDTVMPRVTTHRNFKNFVGNELPEIAKGTLALAAHPEAPEPCPRHVAGGVTVAIGPEGGFVPSETDLLRAAGFRLVSMGERILKVETAVPAILSRLF